MAFVSHHSEGDVSVSHGKLSEIAESDSMRSRTLSDVFLSACVKPANCVKAFFWVVDSGGMIRQVQVFAEDIVMTFEEQLSSILSLQRC